MLWIKAFHVIAVVCWFAALFYLPRLFVYHAQATDAISLERFQIMERKLYRGIMTPAMIATLVLGGWLLGLNWDYYKSQGWMHAKLTLVALLVIYHFMCGHYRQALIHSPTQRKHTFFRIFNELPVFGLVGIVILVIVRPF